MDDAEPDVEDVEIAPELDEEEPSPKARKAPKPVAEVNQPWVLSHSKRILVSKYSFSK